MFYSWLSNLDPNKPATNFMLCENSEQMKLLLKK